MTRVRRLRAPMVAVLLSLALATGCSDDPVGSAGEPRPSGTSTPQPTEGDEGPDDSRSGSGDDDNFVLQSLHQLAPRVKN